MESCLERYVYPKAAGLGLAIKGWAWEGDNVSTSAKGAYIYAMALGRGYSPVVLLHLVGGLPMELCLDPGL
jgi:hypothetical protein